MAGYRLCIGREAARPYYIECIGTSIGTIEELCFFFYEYMPLIDASVMNEALTRWVAAELQLEETAGQMEEALRNRMDCAGFVLPVFEAAGWLDNKEMAAYKMRLDRFFAESPAVRLKMKGDALVRCGRMNAASAIYRQIIDESAHLKLAKEFLASVWYNKGVAEIKMLLYAEALSSFKTAVRLCEKPLYVRSVLLVLGLSKPRDKYVEEAAAFNPDPEVSKEAESLLQFVRGDAGNIRLPKDPDAFIRESVEAYHVATGV